MSTSRSTAIWFCVFALLVVQITAASANKRKIEEERRIRALRPSFVKRETQAPLIHAGDEKIEEEYIVKLRDDLTDEELAAFEAKFQALAEEHGLHIDFQIDLTSLMKGFVARVPADAVEILRWLDEVEFVEEDEVIHGNVEWGLDRIDQADLPLDDVYSSAPLGDGSGVNVFVLDTGIRFTHNEFGGRAFSFYDAFSDGQNGNDCDGHGTHCAGTIGGSTVGVAPGVTLYSGRVLDCSGSGSNSGVIGGMDAVAASNMKPAVVSMSLGGGYSSSLNLAAKRLTDAGYILVVAAGNDDTDACNTSPASAAEAITVGATESDDDLAWYSNYGSCVNILAPGSDVRSASHSGDASYTSKSGTSMATPHVAGVAALLLEQDSSLTQTTMLNKLLEAAQTGKIDLSRLSDSSSTPNKLLNIPTATVFHVVGAGGRYTLDFFEAVSACSSVNARMASYGELVAAWEQGLEECRGGWLVGRRVAYPMQRVDSNCGSRIGVIDWGFRPTSEQYDVYCYPEVIKVFHVVGAGGRYSLNYDSARTACTNNQGRIATYDELVEAWGQGLEECRGGWLEGGRVAYPMQRVDGNCGSRIGVIDWGIRPTSEQYDVYCYPEDISQLCSNTCRYPGDNECDDGGPNSQYSLCDYGTDCDDCGPRPPL